MANIRTTFLFELTTITKGNTVQPARETGWTETMVSVAADTNDVGLVQAANRYATARMPLLANQGRLIGYRFHSLDNNQTSPYPFTAPWIGSGGDCTLPQVALLTRLYAENGFNNRALELRGLPGDVVVTGEYKPNGFNPARLTAFFNSIVQTYGMMGIDKTNPRFKVRTVQANGTVNLGEDQVGINAGMDVKFYRTKADDTCCGAIGVFKVTAATPRTLTLADYDGGDATGGKVAIFSKPTFRRFNATTTPGGSPAGWGIERTVIRKSGRPFDLFSGRRSKTCCKC